MGDQFLSAHLPNLTRTDPSIAGALLKRLHMGRISAYFDYCCEQAAKDTELPFWLSEDYIRETAAELPCLNKNLETVISAIKPVVRNEDLLLFAKTLYQMLSVRRRHEIVFQGLAFPEAPAGAESLPYDMFAVFPLLARVRDAYRELRERGVEESVIANTVKDFDECITRSTDETGRPAFTVLYFRWCTAHSNGALYRIKRLNFELRDYCPFGIRAFVNGAGELKILMLDGISVHKSGLLLGSACATDGEGAFTTTYRESEEYYEGHGIDQSSAGVERFCTRLYKKEWTPIFGPEDIALNIHIPRDEPFTPELVRDSLNAGMEFVRNLHPDLDLKVFLCTSWLLAPELKALLGPHSNILSFQNRFTKFPMTGRGLGPFACVFNRRISALDQLDLDTLPEDTSLQRSLKEFYREGNAVHEAGGLILLAKQQ